MFTKTLIICVLVFFMKSKITFHYPFFLDSDHSGFLVRHQFDLFAVLVAYKPHMKCFHFIHYQFCVKVSP